MKLTTDEAIQVIEEEIVCKTHRQGIAICMALDALENSKPHKYKVTKEMVVEVKARDELEATELAENKFANGEYEIYPYIKKVE